MAKKIRQETSNGPVMDAGGLRIIFLEDDKQEQDAVKVKAVRNPQPALLEFPPHSGALKFAVVPKRAPRFGGQIVITLFGDERPMVAPPGPRAGRALARIDPVNWSLHPLIDQPLRRPIDVAFHPQDGALFILDFGDFEMSADCDIVARRESGRLWRIDLTEL